VDGLTREEIEEIIKRQNGACVYCNKVVHAFDCIIEDLTEDSEVMKKLKGWRLNTANEKKHPAYTVMKDSTLKLIEKRRPANIEELMQIQGIKEGRANKYGKDILRLLGDNPDSPSRREEFQAICGGCDKSEKIAVRLPEGQMERLRELGVPIPEVIRRGVAWSLRGSPGNPEPVVEIDGRGPGWKRYRVIDDDEKVVDTFYKPSDG